MKFHKNKVGMKIWFGIVIFVFILVIATIIYYNLYRPLLEGEDEISQEDASESEGTARQGAADTENEARQGAADTENEARQGAADTEGTARQGAADTEGTARQGAADTEGTARQGASGVEGTARQGASGVEGRARQGAARIEGTARQRGERITQNALAESRKSIKKEKQTASDIAKDSRNIGMDLKTGNTRSLQRNLKKLGDDLKKILTFN